MIPITLIPLFGNYYINYQYMLLWDRLDPPKPEDEDDLNKKEVLLINDCDENFDKWNNKYFKLSDTIRKLTLFGSHKMFNLPFTHFFGYIHFTVRTQDYYCNWEWDEYEVQKWNMRRISYERVSDANYKYRGRLVPRANAHSFEQEMAKDGEAYEGGEASSGFEGGKKGAKLVPEGFNPFDFVQHPSAYPRKQKDRQPDIRVFDLFKSAVKIDLLAIRLPLIIGNSLMCLTYFLDLSASQLYVQVLESIAISFIVMFCEYCIWKNWEEYRLDIKMKDTKANYLFINPKVPNKLKLDTRDADGMELMPEWNKYMHFYKFRDIFLDNKLEELLNIFGRRQCKSCCEFDTGTVLVEDPRRTRSYPLSPRGEVLYQGMAGDFDLIDF